MFQPVTARHNSSHTTTSTPTTAAPLNRHIRCVDLLHHLRHQHEGRNPWCLVNLASQGLGKRVLASRTLCPTALLEYNHWYSRSLPDAASCCSLPSSSSSVNVVIMCACLCLIRSIRMARRVLDVAARFAGSPRPCSSMNFVTPRTIS